VSLARAQVGVTAVGSKVIFTGGVSQVGDAISCQTTDVKTADILDMAVAMCNGNGRCDSADFVSNGALCACNCNWGWGGPSCSAPSCPSYILGAMGSCSFDGLTDVTKAFAVMGMVAPILLTAFAIWRGVVHFKSNDPMAMRPLKENLLGDAKL